MTMMNIFNFDAAKAKSRNTRKLKEWVMIDHDSY